MPTQAFYLQFDATLCLPCFFLFQAEDGIRAFHSFTNLYGLILLHGAGIDRQTDNKRAMPAGIAPVVFYLILFSAPQLTSQTAVQDPGSGRCGLSSLEEVKTVSGEQSI